MPTWLKRFALAVGLTAALAGPAAASSEDLLFGQLHAYSVTFRGNGEAIVAARLVFTNHGSTPLTQLAFAAPGATPTELVAYQQIITSSPCASALIYPAPPCLPQAPDYTQSPSAYGSSGSTYAKAGIAATGSGYSVTLPKAVQPQSSSAILLSYAATGYATRHWSGRYDYHFQTLKVGERVTTSTVAISTDTDLYLAGAGSGVNYNHSASASDLQAGAVASTAALDAAMLNTIAASVGNDGQVNKTARNLAANESFSVTGAYASARWKLYLGRYAWAAGVVLVIGLVIFWIMQQARRRPRRPDDPASWEDLFAAEPVTVGLASALAIGALAWGVTNYLPSGARDTDSFFQLMIMVFSLLMFLILAVGPAVWLGATRRHWRAASLAIVWEVVGLLLLIMLYATVIRPTLASDGAVPVAQPTQINGSAGAASSSASGS
ncbi:MAG TPA: hypothetical protein VI322_01545 [Candidatus Saccharimonadia bacterium]